MVFLSEGPIDSRCSETLSGCLFIVRTLFVFGLRGKPNRNPPFRAPLKKDARKSSRNLPYTDPGIGAAGFLGLCLAFRRRWAFAARRWGCGGEVVVLVT